ncbi:MAG: hypothetical protein L0287_02595 [Anaerolineae bacterium]|nr:hypothetical protein [Anaerolineae bacterium]
MKQNKTADPLLNDNPKIDPWVVIIISAALLIRLAWIVYTNYTEEDAFITFRFARQLAKGHGFVFNVGEPIYGTTTPLFTLLLSIWYKLASGNIVLGARLFDLLAAGGAMLFLWKALHATAQTRTNQLFTLAIIALSSKLWLMDTQGMETPIVLFFMTSSWYMWITRRIVWAGLLTGLLLWTRIDLIPWAAIMVFAELISNRKEAVRLTLIISVVYLPWLIFSTLYFGSPIPYTILAKWVAYSKFNASPLASHLVLTTQYLSIFEIPRGSDQPQLIVFISNLLVLITLGLAIWQTSLKWRDRRLIILPAFAVLEIIRLTLTRETFFNRYFVPTLRAILILAGLALGTIWNLLEQSRLKKIFMILITVGVISMFLFGVQRAQEIRVRQIYRHEASLRAIGLWLHENTSPHAIIQLEPLGYIGYYSDRVIIDEVGLVSITAQGCE